MPTDCPQNMVFEALPKS